MLGRYVRAHQALHYERHTPRGAHENVSQSAGPAPKTTWPNENGGRDVSNRDIPEVDADQYGERGQQPQQVQRGMEPKVRQVEPGDIAELAVRLRADDSVRGVVSWSAGVGLIATVRQPGEVRTEARVMAR